MAEMEEMAMENLREWIFDENKIVSFKWLSLSLSMHVNQSKQILEKFVEQNKDRTGCNLSVIYCLSGFVEDNGCQIFKVQLTTGESLEEAKASFVPPVSCHIYSVQNSPHKNLSSVYIADYDLIKQNIYSTNKFSAIRCESAKLRSQSDTVRSEPVEEAASVTIPIKKDEKPKPNSTAKGVVSFFGKQAQKASTTATAASSQGEKHKSVPDISKATCAASNVDQKSSNNSKKGCAATESSRPRDDPKKKTDKETKKEEKVVQRKRIRIAETSSSEEDEEEKDKGRLWTISKAATIEVTTNVEEMEVDEKENSVIPEPESPIPNNEANQKKVERKMVSKTYVNDEGFMVTEKVWETVVTEEAPAPQEKPVIEPPPPAKKPVAPPQSAAPKKKAQPPKGNKQQTSLMKFFNKQ